MKIKIETINIGKIELVDNLPLLDQQGLSPAWSYLGILHNILLREFLGMVDSPKQTASKMQSIFVERLTKINDDLSLGLDIERVNNCDFLPNKNEDMLEGLMNKVKKDFDNQTFDKAQELIKILKENQDNLKGAAKIIKDRYENSGNTQMKFRREYEIMTAVAYYSSMLYSDPKKTASLFGYDIEEEVISRINWWKVAGCDALGGMFGGLGGAAVASGCSAIMQL